MTPATVCCWAQMFAAKAIPKRNRESCKKSGKTDIMLLKCQSLRPSSFCCLRLQRSSKEPRPNRDVLKSPSYCFPRTAPNAASRLVDRLVNASVWIQISVEFGPVQIGREASCGENVLLSTLFINIFRRAFVVSLGLGLRLESRLMTNAALTAENRPACHIKQRPSKKYLKKKTAM